MIEIFSTPSVTTGYVIKYKQVGLCIYNAMALYSCGSGTFNNFGWEKATKNFWEEALDALHNKGTTQDRSVYYGLSGGTLFAITKSQLSLAKNDIKDNTMPFLSYLLNHENTKHLYSYKNKAHIPYSVMHVFIYHYLGKENLLPPSPNNLLLSNNP